MKNLLCLLMALMLGLVMVACNKQGDLANQQQLLLKAPSGISIVANSDVLMKVALETVSETSGLEITKVDYLPVKTGFAAIVWYKTKGFPNGKLGKQMALVYELQLNGLEEMIRELRKRY